MAASEKKKGRLEALERRLAATPQTPQVQIPPISRPTTVPAESPSVITAPRPPTNPIGVVERENTYGILCKSVRKGPLSSLLKIAKVADASGEINEVLKTLLEGGSKRHRDVESILEKRLQENQVLLLDNPTPNQIPASEKARERAFKDRGKRSRERLSLRQHRKCGSYDLPEQFQEYKLYQPLQEMWAAYARDLLSDCSETMVQTRLLTADLHGAVLSVVQSKNPSYTELQGIMVRETENTFGIVTPNNKFRVIPKVGSIFRVEIDNMRVTLFGNNLSLRSSAAKTKKDGKRKLTSSIEL
ncbi:hypothetical protein R1sor_016980 [Riccia sorocarpa]|uniref:Uncharacterized protein n=1 Tax=Riccia sorocarpa TaxID=122646 RepID=A0ABD3I5H2_9MARC